MIDERNEHPIKRPATSYKSNTNALAVNNIALQFLIQTDTEEVNLWIFKASPKKALIMDFIMGGMTLSFTCPVDAALLGGKTFKNCGESLLWVSRYFEHHCCNFLEQGFVPCVEEGEETSIKEQNTFAWAGESLFLLFAQTAVLFPS